MTDSECITTDTKGIIVQITLAMLVIFVLTFEYLIEIIIYKCNKSKNMRSFRNAWFDAYKICTGALVSHGFNIAVALFVDKTNVNDNECAAYALAFYYETSGVCFVQLLQYGVIQYSIRMSTNRNIKISCQKRWKYISTPGIYDANRYPVSDCLHCRSIQDKTRRQNYCKLLIVIIVVISLAILVGYLTMLFEGNNKYYIYIPTAILTFIFFITTAIAPVSSLWQTFAWVLVKMFEKTLWSIFALLQANLFAQWSNSMSTGNSNTDAWIFLAGLPIILNAFMFWMFSRISRLNIPCFNVKYRNDLDNLINIENNIEIYNQLNNNNDSDIISNIDANNSSLNEMSVSNNIIYNKKMDTKKDELIIKQKSTNLNVSEYNEIKYKKFDKMEAFKVGIVYMLIINFILLVIGVGYLIYKNENKTVWWLLLSMIVVPTFFSVIFIQLISCLHDRMINICCCTDKSFKQKSNQNEDIKLKKLYTQ